MSNQQHWDGKERRVTGTHSDLSEIWELLHAIDKKIDLHIKEEDAYRPKVVELVEILEKSKGAITLIKILVGVIAPTIAALVWLRDHVKL